MCACSNIPVDATEKDIKKAYRNMAVLHHPDKHSPQDAEVYEKRSYACSCIYVLYSVFGASRNMPIGL